MKILLYVSILAAPVAVSAHEITETLETPIRATLHSPKQPFDLEICVADAITQIGGAVPVALRKGPSDVMMLGYGNTPKIIIMLSATPSGTTLEVRTRSGDMDDKLVRNLRESCQM
ncbi:MULTISPECIES: hypothetical protein [Bacteria]|uniref:hypothetical protein n=1 Tax=Bacteria TaxID=2 RepID=UPI00103CB950|nr:MULTISPECIES: hypothetical protein [Bacteria]QDM40525.1 hypothetical protein C0V74_05310 [Altererythrobacter sp. TH136]TCJ38954.1 hypothetical protein E0504_11680 [Parafrankia sp. BMG5.11]